MTPPLLDAQAALFLDLDGTLLEIAPQPESVSVPATLPVLLGRLARQRGGALAVVSGRRIADLDRLLQPWRAAAAGMHGAERRRFDGTCIAAGGSAADAAAAIALARLRPALRQIAREPGLLLEDKGATIALHYRLAPRLAEMVRAEMERLAEQERDWLRLIAGKMVFELQPRHHGKGGAIAAFLAEPPFQGRAPVFVGDDTTDEEGFAEVNRRGGISIRVGPPIARTASTYTLPSVSAVHEWLARGLSTRAG